MVTAEQELRNEGWAAGWRECLERTRKEIDAAYARGVEDGAANRLPTLLAGVVAGAFGATAWAIWFLV